MGVRRQAREAAVQLVYMCDFLNRWDIEEVLFAFTHFGINGAVRPYSEVLLRGVVESLPKLDSCITRSSEHWSLGRMSRVDRAIIRVAAFELAFLPDVPKNVAINEAIEIAKRFGSDESPNFVNGVLDRLASIIQATDDSQNLKIA
ncbi:MAG: transcription antitermination factor NusB [Deltaproteobacteria bacterium]|nr:transcription antitermination factor NusB [Deltaproteobacteria bacterium]